MKNKMNTIFAFSDNTARDPRSVVGIKRVASAIIGDFMKSLYVTDGGDFQVRPAHFNAATRTSRTCSCNLPLSALEMTSSHIL